MKPSVLVPELKTKAMYGALHPSHYSNGEHTKRAVSAIERGAGRDLPAIGSMIDEHQPPVSPSLGGKGECGGHPQSPGRKNPAPLFQGLSMYNAFDAIAFDMYEGVEWYWKQFISAGAAEVHLAGAGPTLCTMLTDQGQAEKLSRSLLDLGLETYIVKTISRSN
jgi:hypothetical protein